MGRSLPYSAEQIANSHSGLLAATTAPTSLGSSISCYSWTYDTLGRAASFTAPEGTFAYGYDNTHQITSATFTVASGYTGGTPATESFNFDDTGNRTSTGSSVSHNRLLSDGTYNYTYDGEGNRTSRTEIATGKYVIYSWDHRNRLTRVEYRNSASGPATKVVANTYDAFDRRVMKQVDDNGDGTFDRTERYIWDGDQINLVLDANGAVLHRFLNGPAIDQVFADESSVDGLLWDLGDNQNTTRDVINNSGTVVNHVTYSAFGVIASESNTAKTPFFAYTGRDWDEDLNLQYNRGRWYEASSGRWLSDDPLRFAGGDTNLQRYVGNGPTSFTDPSGLFQSGMRPAPNQVLVPRTPSVDRSDPNPIVGSGTPFSAPIRLETTGNARVEIAPGVTLVPAPSGTGTAISLPATWATGPTGWTIPLTPTPNSGTPRGPTTIGRPGAAIPVIVHGP